MIERSTENRGLAPFPIAWLRRGPVPPAVLVEERAAWLDRMILLDEMGREDDPEVEVRAAIENRRRQLAIRSRATP